MSVSLQYIARVLNRSSVSLHEYASNVLFSAAVPEIQFSDNFLIEVRHHYIKLFTRLLLSSITYMQYFQRSTMLCIDVEHAVDVLRSDSTFNSMQSPPISLLINKTFNDDENEATGDSDKTLRDEEGSRESGSFVGIEGKEGEDVDEGGDGDDEEDDDDEDDDEEDDYEEDDDEDDEDEYDEEDEEVDELWERESLDSAQKMSIFLGEECAFINSIDPSYLPPEFIKLYQDVSNDNRIYLETVSLTALRMMYEYTNDQIALSLEHPSTSVLRFDGVNLGLLKRCLAAESLNALSQSSSVPVSNAPVAPTTTVAGVSSSSSVPCVPSVNELLATEQANSSALMKSLQDLYRVLVREALDLEASGTANSSSNSNIDVATLLLNRCVKYEGTFKKLELERDQAKTRVAELEKRLIDVYQLSSSVTLLSQINNHQLSSSSAANDTRVSFESNHVDRQAGRETAINSEGATSLASGMSAPLSIASSLPDSNAAKLKRKHRQEADEDSQLTERLSNHSVPYSSNKQGRQAE